MPSAVGSVVVAPFFLPSSPRLRTESPEFVLELPRVQRRPGLGEGVQHLLLEQRDFAALHPQPADHLEAGLGGVLSQPKRPGEVVPAQHVGAAARRREFQDPVGQDVRVHLPAPDAGPGEKCEVGVGAAHGPGPAGPGQHLFRRAAGQRAVQALPVPGPGAQPLRA